MNTWNILLVTCCLAGCSVTDKNVEVIVENPGNTLRKGEIVELSLDRLQEKLDLTDGTILVTDSKNNLVESQITYDNYLIFPVEVDAGCSVSYRLTMGKAVPTDTAVCGRVYPERLDDLAWENDKAAYRVYGPAFQQRGDKGFGYDILTKSVSHPVLEQRYRMELDTVAASRMDALRKEGRHREADSIYHSISYHVDHGNGMDCYNVGSTLGGGTTALMVDSTIIYPYCYKECTVLDNGPLRFTAKLVFHPLTVKQDSNVVETRIISLDKGSYLNRTDVSYSGLSQSETLVTGIVLHEQNSDGYSFCKEENYIAYADSTNDVHSDNGIIFVGAVFNDSALDFGIKLFKKSNSDAIGHVLGYHPYSLESVFRYYWGSGWSKADMPDMQAWESYLKEFSERLRNPLKITINRKKHYGTGF